MKEFGDFIANRKGLVFIIAVILLILSIFGIAATKIDYDLTTYLPKDLESIQGLKILDEDFGDASIEIMKVNKMKSHDVIELKDKIAKVDGVEQVIWLDDIIDPNIPKEMFPDDFNKIFNADDGSTTMFIEFSEPALSEGTQNAISQVRKTAKKECLLGGIGAVANDLSNLIGNEISLLGTVVIVLLLLVLALTLGSILVPFIIFLGAIFPIAYNMGTNVFMSQVSSASMSLVAVLQLGFIFIVSIFFYNRYKNEKEIYETKEEAMSETISQLTVVVAIVAIAVIAVSLSVLAMNAKLSKDIAILCTKGIIFSLLTTITIFPVLILACDTAIVKLSHKPLVPTFEGTTNFVLSHYKGLSFTLIAIFILAFIGKQNVKVNYNMLEALPQDLDSIVVINELKGNLNAPTTHVVIVNKNIDSYKLVEMSDKISKVEGINTVIGEDALIGPNVAREIIPEDIREIYTSDKYKLIVANSDYKAGSYEENIQVDKVNSIVKEYDKKGIVTGEGAIYKDLSDITENGLVDIKVAAVLGILLVIALVFGSWSLPLILVFTVQTAVFASTGILFYFGQEVPCMLLNILGLLNLALATTYAIFLTCKFKEELMSGKDRYEAIGYANEDISKSIIACTLPFFIAATVAAIISKVQLISIVFTLVAITALINTIVMVMMLPAVLTASEDFISRTSLFWTNRIRKDTNLTEER